MITDNGKTQVKRYLGGLVPVIASHMAFGVGPTAVAASQQRLQFEIDRVPLSLITYDFVNDKVVFKADVPEEYSGSIHEVGLFAADANLEGGSRLITTFDSATEEWIDGSGAAAAFTTGGGTRIGDDSLQHVTAASASKNSTISMLDLDLSNYSNNDSFTFAFNVADANNANVIIRFMTDSANYYTYTLGAQSAGYKMITATKGSATATGTPSWSLITQIKVETTSKSTGSSTTNFDGIRLEDVDAVSTDSFIIARQVLGAPVTKIAGQGRTFEYSMSVSAS